MLVITGTPSQVAGGRHVTVRQCGSEFTNTMIRLTLVTQAGNNIMISSLRENLLIIHTIQSFSGYLVIKQRHGPNGAYDNCIL